MHCICNSDKRVAKLCCIIFVPHEHEHYTLMIFFPCTFVYIAGPGPGPEVGVGVVGVEVVHFLIQHYCIKSRISAAFIPAISSVSANVLKLSNGSISK